MPTVRTAIVPKSWRPPQVEAYQREQGCGGFRAEDVQAPSVLVEVQPDPPPPPPPSSRRTDAFSDEELTALRGQASNAKTLEDVKAAMILILDKLAGKA